MRSHCNSLHAVDYINSGSLLKHGRRDLTFTNYTSFSICIWNDKRSFETPISPRPMRWVKSGCVMRTPTFCCVALKSIEKASPKNVSQKPPAFCGLWVMCLFSKIGRIKTKIHHFFCLLILCKDAFFFNTLIFNRSRSRTFQSHYRLL